MAQYDTRTSVVFENVGRSWEHDLDTTTSADHRLWEWIGRELGTRRYRTSNGSLVLAADWRPMLMEMDRLASVTVREYFALPVAERPALLAGKPVKVQIAVTERTSRRTPQDAGRYIRHYLYEVFLIANIAVPGSFTSGRVDIGPSSASSSTFSLDGSFFEDAWITSARHGWPAITPLEPNSVFNWLSALQLKTDQIATSRAAKALFSVLHACRIDPTEPLAVMWLAQCLESLYALPTALSQNLLVARTQALLGRPQNVQWLRAQMTEFFRARNSFAHGGAEIVHPMFDEVFDSRVNEFFLRWMAPADFAASIVVATLQQWADKRWADIEWKEVPEAVLLAGA